MKFSQEQIEAIQNRKNCVVTAGAGSGKTAVLSERFISLLLDEKNPAKVEEILTLTFTKKAAGEMKERIYRKIVEKAKDPSLSSAQQLLLREAQNRFERATVSTIDSFCNEITNNALPLLGVPGKFNIDPQSVAAIRKQEALNCMSAADPASAVFRLLRTSGFETVVDKLFGSFGAQFSIFEDPKMEERMRLQQEIVSEEIETQYRDLESVCEIALEETDESTAGLKEAADTIRSVLAEWETAERDCVLSRLCAFKLPGGKSNERRDAFKQQLKTVREAASAIRDLFGYFEQFGDWLDIARLLDRFAAAVRCRQIKNGVLDYRDVAVGALKALKEDKALRLRYKKKFRFIMVDEFQDNNLMQKELFYLLAEKTDRCGDTLPKADDLEPDKLFFVGDEKQSIYLFRGADVSVFRMLQKESSVLELTKNYRSEPDLIRFFNFFFPKYVMTSDEENADDHEAIFKELHFREAKNDRCEIELALFDSSLNATEHEYLLPRESEFYYIAQWIRKRVASPSFQIDDGGTRRQARFSDFLVLSRTSSEQRALERIFREQGIPYSCEKKLTLFSESIAVDFLQMLKAAIYPNDRIAYLAFLRSPLVSISVSTLTLLLDGGDCNDPLIEEADKKLSRVRELFSGDSLTELFRLFWYDFGYRFFVIKKRKNRHYEELADFFLSYLNQKEESGCSVIDLIAELSDGGSVDENLFSFSEKTNAVSVMTIHKSKGLEAPVVILSQIDKGSGGDTGAAVFRQYRRSVSLQAQCRLETQNIAVNRGICDWIDFVIPPENYYFNGTETPKRIRSVESDLNKAEGKRLLYVALTRAESHLLITGKISDKIRSDSFFPYFKPLTEQGNGTFEGDGFALKIGCRACVEAEEYRKTRDPQLYNADETEKALEKLKNRPDEPIDFSHLFWKNEKTASAKTSSGENGDGERLPSTDLDDFLEETDTFSLFGTLCHEVLEKALRTKDFDLSQIDVASMIDGRLSARKAVAETVVRRLVTRFFASSFFEEHGNGELLPEKEFLLKREEGGRTVFVSCRSDLIIKHSDRIVIVDFKTDRVKIPGFYDSQLSLYAEAAEAIYGLPVETRAIYLREL